MGLCEEQQRALVVVITLGARGECWNQPSWVAGTVGAARLGTVEEQSSPAHCRVRPSLAPGQPAQPTPSWVEASGADQCPLFAVWMCLEHDWPLYMGAV